MKNKHINLKDIYTRNLDKFLSREPKDDLSQASESTMQNESKNASSVRPPQFKRNPLLSNSKYCKQQEGYLNQTVTNFNEDDSLTQFNTIDSNASTSKRLSKENPGLSKTTSYFVPLSKLTPSSIANVSKIIPSIASRRAPKDSQSVACNESFLYQSSSRSIKSDRILNQLVKNQEHHINTKQILNQTVSGDVSICGSTPSNLPPSPIKSHTHKREPSIISLESTPELVIVSHEDLLLIEDKLHDILSLLELGHSAHNECFEWWNYYFNSSIAGKYEEYFLNDLNKKKIRSYVSIELLCVMVCYCISLNKDAFARYCKTFKAIFSFLHFNLLLMIKMIIAKQKESDSYYAKLTLMIKKSLTFLKENEVDEFLITSLITHNEANLLKLYLSVIEKEEKTNLLEAPLRSFIASAYKNRESARVEEYNNFFRLNVLKVSNPDGSILASSLSKLKEDLMTKPKPKVPFLAITSKFKYTLVLDLDETLVHLSESSSYNSNNHTLFLRPHLIAFLQQVKKKFELVVFTAGTLDYADSILNAVEKKERFFSARLNREHTLVVGNDFIKDLTKLGRDLSRIVIVDNMPQNYRLQKENGVFIKAFLGDNPNDSALKHLGDILCKIAQESGDIRKGLVKYKDDIVTKVSLNKAD